MILFIDNYDSFTYNLVQYFGELNESIEVFRNDDISLFDIEMRKPKCVVISPGPFTPLHAGISLDLINKFAGIIPILGVCLGHQAIAQAFGGEIIRADIPMHGKASYIYHDNKTIYNGISNPFKAGRYHSLIVNKKKLPSSLEVTAWTEDGEIMGLRHKEYAIEGVQFHPESILTSNGKKILINFLTQIGVNCI